MVTEQTYRSCCKYGGALQQIYFGVGVDDYGCGFELDGFPDTWTESWKYPFKEEH